MNFLFFQNGDFKTKIEVSKINSSFFVSGEEYLNSCLKIIALWNKGNFLFQIYSSGSTGIPKKMDLNKDLIIQSIQRTLTFITIPKNSMIYLPISITGIGGMMQIFRALYLGLDIIIQKPTSNVDILSALKIANSLQKEIALASFVPLQISEMIKNFPKEYQEIKNVLIGGASLNQSDINSIFRFKNNNFLTFGMTETYSHIAYQSIFNQNGFIPLEGIEISQNEDLCLVIENKGFGKIITNDVIEIQTNGNFNIIGRADYIINSGAVKINPEIIEKQASDCLSGKNKLVCFGIKDEKLGQKTVMVIEGVEFDYQSLFLFLKENPKKPYHFPKEIHFLPHFPILPSGKLDRKKIESLFLKKIQAT